tara:strand:- start:917 stop:1402 length:486 start_codon:yes stop_codon:yes gene_type:complete
MFKKLSQFFVLTFFVGLCSANASSDFTWEFECKTEPGQKTVIQESYLQTLAENDFEILRGLTAGNKIKSTCRDQEDVWNFNRFSSITDYDANGDKKAGDSANITFSDFNTQLKETYEITKGTFRTVGDTFSTVTLMIKDPDTEVRPNVAFPEFSVTLELKK